MRRSLRIPATTFGAGLGLWIGLSLGVCLGEAALAARFFSDRDFPAEFMHPDPRSVAYRILGCGAILMAGVLFWRMRSAAFHRDGTAIDADEPYRDLVDNSPEAIIVHRDGQLVYRNAAALRDLGRSDNEAPVGALLADFVHPDDWPDAHATAAVILRTGRATPTTHLRIIRPDGDTRDIQVSSARVVFAGQPAVVTFCRDVTRDLANRADLAASRERLSLALEAAQDGVWDWDMVNDTLIYNQAWFRMLGREPTERALSTETWERLVHPDDLERVKSSLAEHVAGKSDTYEAEVRLRHAAGHYLWILDRGKVVEREDNGSPRRMAGTHRDINEQKRAQMAVAVRNRMAEAFLTSPLETVLPKVLALISADLGSPSGTIGTYDSASRLRLTFHGATAPARGTDAAIVTREELPPALVEVIEGGNPLILADPIRFMPFDECLDRSVSVPIVSKEKVLGFVAVGNRRDPYTAADAAGLASLAGHLAPILEFHAENQVKESQLRQVQKMEAIGALAGGIAHDFNNILQAILGFSTLALEEARTLGNRPGGFIADDLERVVKATHRGRSLVNRIHLFSRRGEQERQPTEIAPMVHETVDLLRNMIPATIRVSVEVSPGCGPVMTDPAQISQLLMNLATNAFHAMEKTGGELVFGLRPWPAGGSESVVPPALRERQLVEISVTDTGSGIDPASLDRLFDPFFTTKEVDKGTGLGLSVVHGIVTSHGGHIVVDSAPGRGTTVRIFLPTIAAPTATADTGAAGDVTALETGDPVPAPAGAAANGLLTGCRILFLDDERDIVDIGRATLEKQGHRVTALTDAEEALRVLDRDGADFDLFICDLTMPQMTGLQIAARIGTKYPDLPVILITGLNDSGLPAWREQPGIKGLLRKPFTGSALRTAIYEVIGPAAPPTGMEVDGMAPFADLHDTRPTIDGAKGGPPCPES